MSRHASPAGPENGFSLAFEKSRFSGPAHWPQSHALLVFPEVLSCAYIKPFCGVFHEKIGKIVKHNAAEKLYFVKLNENIP